MMQDKYHIIDIAATVVMGGIIGLFTNWLAIRMLFRPYREKKFLGVRLPFTPGMIPKEKHRIAESIADVVGEHLLTKDSLVEALLNEELKKEVRNIINNYIFKMKMEGITIDEFLSRELEQLEKEKLLLELENLFVREIMNSLPHNGFLGIIASTFEGKIREGVQKKKGRMLGSRMGDIISKFDNHNRELLTNIIGRVYENLIQREADKIISAINLKKIIVQKVDEFSVEKVEELIVSISRKELSAITWLGGFLGVIMSLVFLFFK